MTPAQNTLIKNYIDAHPTWGQWESNNTNNDIIKDALNAVADPAFIVWRSSVPQDEIMQNGFDWTRVDNLSVGKARIWEWLFDNSTKSFNPSKVNVRLGIDSAWVGTTADLAVRAAIYVHCRRSANLLEQILATGTGTTESPAVMGYEGTITRDDVEYARYIG